MFYQFRATLNQDKWKGKRQGSSFIYRAGVGKRRHVTRPSHVIPTTKKCIIIRIKSKRINLKSNSLSFLSDSLRFFLAVVVVIVAVCLFVFVRGTIHQILWKNSLPGSCGILRCMAALEDSLKFPCMVHRDYFPPRLFIYSLKESADALEFFGMLWDGLQLLGVGISRRFPFPLGLRRPPRVTGILEGWSEIVHSICFVYLRTDLTVAKHATDDNILMDECQLLIQLIGNEHKLNSIHRLGKFCFFLQELCMENSENSENGFESVLETLLNHRNAIRNIQV